MLKNIFNKILIITVIVCLSGCSWRKKKVDIQEDQNISQTELIEPEALKLDHDDICADSCDDVVVDVSPYESEEQPLEKISIYAADSEDLKDEDGKELKCEHTPKKDSVNEISQALSLTPIVEDFLNNVTAEKDNSSDKLNQKEIGRVYFEFDRYKKPKNNDYSELKSICDTISKAFMHNPHIKILVTGHACNYAGSEKYNLQLSSKRASVIAQYIKKHTKVSSDNIMSYGCGTSQLIATGNKEQQSVNRRAEVFVCE